MHLKGYLGKAVLRGNLDALHVLTADTGCKEAKKYHWLHSCHARLHQSFISLHLELRLKVKTKLYQISEVTTSDNRATRSLATTLPSVL